MCGESPQELATAEGVRPAELRRLAQPASLAGRPARGTSLRTAVIVILHLRRCTCVGPVCWTCGWTWAKSQPSKGFVERPPLTHERVMLNSGV